MKNHKLYLPTINIFNIAEPSNRQTKYLQNMLIYEKMCTENISRISLLGAEKNVLQYFTFLVFVALPTEKIFTEYMLMGKRKKNKKIGL